MKTLNRILFVLLFIPALHAQDFYKGPLYGKNQFIPQMIYYNFPATSARSGNAFDLEYHVATYLSNDVMFQLDEKEYDKFIKSNAPRSYPKKNVVRDNELWSNEVEVSFRPLSELQIGTNLRVLSYSGGFLDPIIEGFHGIFHFPNAGRDYFLQNQLYVNIPNDNGVPLFLDKPTVAFGDIDLWAKYTFWENKLWSLAAMGAFKIPTGRLATLSGSGYPDIGAAMLADVRPLWWLALYMQAGLVVPFDGRSYPMFNGVAAAEFSLSELFSLNAQFNIKTSALSHKTIKRIALPQTNFLFGFIFRHRQFTWQFYMEEDPFTYQGTDFTWNLMFSHKIPLQKN
ncbi:MAG: DUF3187 family protein [Spirochaetaceae bacterium]|nr:DUF3187 family protein [Spirochaetaceae bacterium]